MRPYERWTESYLDGKLFESNYDLFERRLATPELLAKLETLFEPLSQLKTNPTTPLKTFHGIALIDEKSIEFLRCNLAFWLSEGGRMVSANIR